MSSSATGKIITFYSYKGGTGRSMILANVAWILASQGKRVLTLDWDLEAPGLHRYFQPFLVDRDLASSDGVIDFVTDFAMEAMTPSEKEEGAATDWYVEHANILRYAVSLDWEFPQGGTLDFIAAGRQTSSYSSKVNSFNWQNFYDRLGGGVFLEAAKNKIRSDYDYVLIDSRTGVSDTAGICTVQFPDMLVVCFTLNNQSIEGAASVAASVYEQRGTDGVHIFPVPMRIENAEKRKLERRTVYAKNKFSLFPDFVPNSTWEKYWEDIPVPYIPFYAYEEVLAAFGDTERKVTSLLASAERLTGYLTLGEVKRLAPLSDWSRQEILLRYEGTPTSTDPLSEINRAAEVVFASFAPEEQQLVQRIFTRLVRVADAGDLVGDGRGKIRIEELGPTASVTVKALSNVRLLEIEQDVFGSATTVQIAQEQLLKGWERLKTWIDQDREFLVWRQNLRLRLQEWLRGDQDQKFLLRGDALEEAMQKLNERGLDINEEERGFITRSAQPQDHEERSLEAGYRVFVLMPFGVKEGIDFNRVYQDFIKPALESVGFAVSRTDEEMRAGDIRTDMFQELVLTDLVVADVSIDNVNVWYNLGVRHALRARGVIGIRCQRDYMPFDVYSDRSLRYHIKDGAPDPAFLEEDKKALGSFAAETIESWYDRKISPVYHLLPALKEPHFKWLQVEGAKEFWSWDKRIEIARKGNRPGDILVLAEEAPNIAFRIEAYRNAGNALRSLGQFALALDQYEKALALAPDDLESRRQKGLLLGRLKQSDAAKEWLQNLVKEVPDDAESWALLGRVEKDSWIGGWRADGKTVEQMQQDAAADDYLLQEAIDAYAKAFLKDSRHYYSGINAVALMHLLAHLTGNQEQSGLRQEMEGGVRWAVRGALDWDSKDYWARLTLAELEVLSGKREIVEAALKSAVAVADKDWFKLNSSREQLLLYRDLGFRPAEVKGCLEIIDRALSRVPRPESRWTPRQVFLFSGHMIDHPDRWEPRFPADKEPIAAKAIAEKLDALGAGPEDLAICSGACGGDLLFAEACLARGLKLELHIPFDEPTFLRNSVSFAPGNWTDRFYQVKSNPNTRLLVMPDELGSTAKNVNPYGRNNLWQLHTALSWGPDKVRFICLWNRKGGDGPGGTEHMYETVQKYSGRVYVLDTNVLW